MKCARILSPSPENIQLTARALSSGKVVGMPTETVYGLAGNALNPEALSRIFDTKERPTFDPLIVHVPERLLSQGLQGLIDFGLVDGKRMLEVAKERVDALIHRFWPGPLTLVLPKNARVPDLATAGLPSVALRMPRHPVAQALLAEVNLPLAAPSANRFGRISPTRAEHVLQELGDRIEFILDGGPCEIGVESTVLAIAPDGTPSLLRPGGISEREISDFLETQVQRGVSGETQGAAIAQGRSAAPGPGMLESHYAPEKPLFLLSRPLSEISSDERALQTALALHPSKLGILLICGSADEAGKRLQTLTGTPAWAQTLSATGKLTEVAQNLFCGLRQLDQSDADVLLIEPCPSQEGIGHAISDRIRRAAAKRQS